MPKVSRYLYIAVLIVVAMGVLGFHLIQQQEARLKRLAEMENVPEEAAELDANGDGSHNAGGGMQEPERDTENQFPDLPTQQGHA